MLHPFTSSLWLWRPLCAAALMLAALQAPAQQGPQPPLRTVSLSAGIHVVRAEVAQSETERQMGLMFRREMGPNDGMLFVFEEPGLHCFWMRNTLLPLSIAFLADDGTVVNILDMQPQTLQSNCPLKPVRYALEMHQGWFAKRAVKAGSRLAGPPFARAR